MVAFSWIFVASIGFVLSVASCKRDSNIRMNLVRDDLETRLYRYLYAKEPTRGVHKKGLLASTPMRQCSPSLRSKTNNNNPTFDVYPIGDLKFSVPIRTAAGLRKMKVLAECGFLVGLSDYQPFSPFEPSEKHRPGYSELTFRWKNLKARCKLLADVDGLTTTGDSDVLVKPLYMLVQRETSVDPPSTKVQMPESKEATVNILGMGSVPSEQLDAIKLELESRVVCIVNSHVRDVLVDFIETSYRNRAMPHMAKLMHHW